jgi:predicted RNA-binding Zn-ribbon protein involved in translation (DUF1610 family)
MRGCRIECILATVKISNRSNLRLRSARRTMLGGIALALLLSQVAPADAVTIDSQTPPSVTGANDDGADSLLNASAGGTITLQIRASDPADDSRFGLTSGHLAVSRNLTLSDTPVSLLRMKRDRSAASSRIVQSDSYHPVAMEDLMIGERLAPAVQLMILTAGGIAMLFLSVVLSYRQLQRPRGKRVRFGILWHGFKPICGKCGGLLSVLNDYSFQCPSCGVELGARGENGKAISPREALLKIRDREYW